MAYELQLRGATLDYKVDLDLIAPLGTGNGNAATYFKDFAKPGGSRLKEAADAAGRRVALKQSASDFVDMALPGNDPLLLEAEPWVDQAAMRFYPQIWSPIGWDTQVPNLLHCMVLGKSWIARGRAQSTTEKTKEDFRRVVRLGRLLRQDDVTLIQDLIGVALIRLGATALYDVARREQDGAATTLNALVINDSNALRSETRRRGDEFGLTQDNIDADGVWARLFGPSFDLSSRHLDRIMDVVRNGKERRFRMEALGLLWAVKNEASSEQAMKAAEVLEAAAKDRDPIVAANARFLATAKWDKKLLDTMPRR